MNFDFIKIRLGPEMVDCRPIQWEGEESVEFITVCSGCDQMVQFHRVEIRNKYVECPHCHAPPPSPKPPRATTRSNASIQDPIQVGRMILPGAVRIV